MRLTILFFISVIFPANLFAQNTNLIETSDINLFWKVYDKVILAHDSATAIQLIQKEYIDKASDGLSEIKNYNVFESKDLYKMIKTQRLYLNSIRQKTLGIKDHSDQYRQIFGNFKRIYPNYSYPKVYFTIGAMLVGGINGSNGNVIIGTELVSASKFSKNDNLNAYHKLYAINNPGIDYTIAHELVHTQQIRGFYQNFNLTGICLMEGSADFIAHLLIHKKNTMPYTIYGRKHQKLLKQLFTNDKLSSESDVFDDWIYNTVHYVNGRKVKMPDLGYYIGYKICESYYNKAANKMQAVNDILQIDYKDKNSVMTFYQNSGFEISEF